MFHATWFNTKVCLDIQRACHLFPTGAGSANIAAAFDVHAASRVMIYPSTFTHHRYGRAGSPQLSPRFQQSIAKDAPSAPVNIGQVFHSNATPEKNSVLLCGTLMQEVYMRTLCLQALQVRVPLLVENSA